MRFFFKVSLWLLVLLIFLGLIFGGVFFLAVNYPQKAWSLAQQVFLPKDLSIDWQSVSFKAEREDGLKWNVDWQINQLRLLRTQPEWSIPLQQVHLLFRLSLVPSDLYLNFRQVDLEADQPVTIAFTESQESVESKNLYQVIEGQLASLRSVGQYVTVDKLEVKIKEAKLSRHKADPVWISLSAQKPASQAEPRAMAMSVRLQAEHLSGTFNGTFVFENLTGSDKPFLKSSIQLAKDGFMLSGDGAATAAGDQIFVTYKGAFDLTVDGQEVAFNPDVTAAIGPKAVDLRVSSSVKKLPQSFPDLENWSAQINIPFVPNEHWSDEAATFKVAGGFPLFFVNPRMRVPLEESCKCQFPKAINVGAHGKFWPKHLASDFNYKLALAEVVVQVESFRNKLFSLDLGASTKIFKKGGEWSYEPEVDSFLRVSSFQSLRKFLDSQNIMIPAPFDVLDGTVDFKAKGPLTLAKEGHRARLQMLTNLHSENQKVNLESEVSVSLDSNLKGAEVLLRLLIQDLQVELPPFDLISGMPALRPDERVQMVPRAPVAKKQAEPSEAFKLRLMWAAETKTPGAIKLLTKYAKPNVPLTLDVKRGISGDIAGYLKTELFEAQYFRRSMTVEQLRVLTYERDVDADFPVDGRLRIDQTQYTIFLDISGTLRSPFIKLSSEPELPRADIISVLLFDRKRDQLAAVDAESAGNFEAAISDRAIGLLGLWAFATTPIRSFSYNSATKVYSATVQLADSVTASIGTKWEEAAHLEVRKRISKHWVLTATWAPNDRDPQSGRLVLQWEKRF